MMIYSGSTLGARFARQSTAILPSSTQSRDNDSAQSSISVCRRARASQCRNLRIGERLGNRAFQPRKDVALRNGSARRFPACATRAGLVQKVSAKELDDFLASERKQPLVVDFYATWCGPCIILAEQLEALAVQYGSNVRFLKVDTDEEFELAQQMQIRGFPTMVFVSQDPEKLAVRTEGLLSSQVIRDIIEREL